MNEIRSEPLLASPVFVGSIVVLLVNDHVLKAAWPGFVTGKLSDVAGVAMVAIGLTAVLRRPSPACALTAVGFGLLKTVPLAAEWAAPVLGGVTRTDPSDLLALSVLAPLWHWMRGPVRGRGSSSTSGRRRPADRRAVATLAVQVVAIGAAVFATTATSCGEEGVVALRAGPDGRIETYAADVLTYVSVDGGLSWSRGSLGLDASDAAGECLDGWGCLDRTQATVDRVAGDQRTTLLEVGDQERDDLASLDRRACSAELPGRPVVVRVDGVEHVVVPMGWLGALHAADGDRWEWVAIGPWGIQRQDVADRPLGYRVRSSVPDLGWGWRLPGPLINAVIVASPFLVFASIVPLRRLARALGRSPDGVTVAVAAWGALVLGGAGLVGVAALLGSPRSTLTPGAVILGLAAIAGVAVIAAVQRLVGRRAIAPLPPPDPWTRVG